MESEIIKQKCTCCDGSMVVERLVNSTDYYFEGQEPIVELEPCECECHCEKE